MKRAIFITVISALLTVSIFNIIVCAVDGDGIGRDIDWSKWWQTEYIAGDFDKNEIVDSDDAIYLLYYVFYPEDYKIDQFADFTKNGVIDSDDAVYLLYHVFFPDQYKI